MAGFFALLAILYVLSWVWVVKDSAESMRAHSSGHNGVVEIESCLDNGVGINLRRSWTCEGSFDADDGSFAIPSVTLRVHDDSRPSGELPAKVAGHDRDSAWVLGDVEWATALVLTAALPVIVWFLLRWALEMITPRGGWPR